MNRAKNHYIKYSRAELENYTKQPESCVKKINCVEPIRFSPTIIADFQQSILRILSRKIGRFDVKLNGIMLDFRNTKILATQSAIRQDSPFTIINVAADFYVFSPQRGAVVTGTVKYINRMSMETVISVVIYRVFNVKVTVKGKVKQELEKNSDIQIRVKDFNFDNVIPFIEGEIFETGFIAKTSTKKLFDEMIDSGISESSITSEVHKEKEQTRPGPSRELFKVKQERESSVESTTRQPEVKRKRKRKASNDNDSFLTPMKTEIKAERMLSADEELEPFQGISNTRHVDEPLLKSRKRTEKYELTPLSSSTQIASKKYPELKNKVSDKESTSTKDKSSKKKKKKRLDDLDDFETSLQMLLNSNIKEEK